MLPKSMISGRKFNLKLTECKDDGLMKLFLVTYKLGSMGVRALLRLESHDEIIPSLQLYHGEKSKNIVIKNIREVEEKQKFLHVQYFD